MPSNVPLPASDVSGKLAGCLDDPARVVLVQDGESVTAGRINALASSFADRRSKDAPQRLAIHAVRADTTLAALIAGLKTGSEILLLREVYPPNDPFWKDAGVAALFDRDLKLQHSWPAAILSQQPAVLLTTSGTTGKPKVVVHAMGNLLGRVRAGQSGDRWLLSYHPASFAGLQVLLTAFCSKSTLVAFAGLSAAELVTRTLTSDVTHVSGTPTFWRALLLSQSTQGKRLPLRQITIGGEAVDQSTLDALSGAFPDSRIIHIYASTEAGALFAVKDKRGGFPAAWLEEGIDGCRLRIVDGILEVLSPRAMKGYLGGGAQGGFSADGWFITGDLVTVTGDRVLFRGRTDSVINVGGGKVMPEQVEAALLEVPVVREARVYGVKNPIAGDVLAADVVLAEAVSEADARKAIFSALSARLEPYKVPRIYRFMEKIPVNETGKKSRAGL